MEPKLSDQAIESSTTAALRKYLLQTIERKSIRLTVVPGSLAIHAPDRMLDMLAGDLNTVYAMI